MALLYTKKCIALCWCRTPNSDNDKKASKALSSLLSKFDAEGKAIKMGDTNCDFKKSKKALLDI